MCVHSTHCCKCGCKYGDSYCPVEHGSDPGIKCEYCDDESYELQPVLDMLNSAFKNDPSAIHALIVNRVPCNLSMADSEYIVVDKNEVINSGNFSLNAFGLLNGVLSSLGLPMVMLKWSGTDPNKLLGFCEYRE